MLTGFKIGNFKAFAATQSIPIRPLTLIFGANSAGKSSIIHGLLYGSQVEAAGELDVHEIAVAGNSVDLGGFNQFVHQSDSRREVTWGIDVAVSEVNRLLADLLPGFKTATVSVRIGTQDDGLIVRNCTVHTDGELLAEMPLLYSPNYVTGFEPDDRSSMKTPRGLDRYSVNTLKRPTLPAKLKIGELNFEHPVIRKCLCESIARSAGLTMTEADVARLKRDQDKILEDIQVVRDRLLPKCVDSRFFNSRVDRELCEGKRLRVTARNRNSRVSQIARLCVANFFDNVVRSLHKAVLQRLADLRYLGPLRSYPPRGVLVSSARDANWMAGGGFAWDALRSDRAVRAKINDWLGSRSKLGTSYEISIRRYAELDAVVLAVEKVLKKSGARRKPGGATQIAEKIRTAIERENCSSPEEELSEVLLRDSRNGTVVSHRDVGVGISQVLPVLVAAYATSGYVHAIEQPEIHLHPALQSELGDVFIESALGEQKNTFLLETHSEHLILRVLRRVRETSEGRLPKGLIPITPEDVSVLCVQPGGDGSQVLHLPVTANGDFSTDWPNGFFTERAEELF